MKPHQLHSQEYIGDHRYAWWNRDYIQLLLGRINFNDVYSIADIGVGAAHWTAAILRETRHPMMVCCVDFEERWLQSAMETLSHIPGNHRITTVLADAHNLPQEDGSFDLTTCQTLLMHCGNPHKAVQEMVRITKPSGYVLAVEPANILNRMQFFDALLHLQPEEQARLYYIWACYHAGQKKATGANHDIAPLIPEMLRQAGLVDIQVYQNDRVIIADNSDETFDVMAKEYEKDVFKEYARVGGATEKDISESRLVFEKLTMESRKDKRLSITPVKSFVFLGKKNVVTEGA